MTGPFGTTAGPWEIDGMGDIVSGPLNVCIPYATRKEDKRAIAQVPAMLELVKLMAECCDTACSEYAAMARKISAELEVK